MNDTDAGKVNNCFSSLSRTEPYWETPRTGVPSLNPMLLRLLWSPETFLKFALDLCVASTGQLAAFDRLMTGGGGIRVKNKTAYNGCGDSAFYRAMHLSAYARSWDRMSSVRLSVCL